MLRTEDGGCLRKHYLLEKDEDGAFTVGVEYPERTLRPGETLSTAPAVVTATDGDWHRGLEAYRRWVAEWHRPLVPRKPWFREVFNFRQRFLWTWDPLYDAGEGRIPPAKRGGRGPPRVRRHRVPAPVRLGQRAALRPDLRAHGRLLAVPDVPRRARGVPAGHRRGAGPGRARGTLHRGVFAPGAGKARPEARPRVAARGPRRPADVLAREHRDVHLPGRRRVARGAGVDLRGQGPRAGRGRDVHRRVRVRQCRQGLLFIRARPPRAELRGGHRARRDAGDPPVDRGGQEERGRLHRGDAGGRDHAVPGRQLHLRDVVVAPRGPWCR